MPAHRKPTALKVLAGNPGKRPLPTNEPTPEIAAPDCPAHLSEEARAEWLRIVPLLLTLRLLTKIDMVALAAYCVLYARWAEAERKVAEGGTLVKVNGQVIPSPHLTIATNSLKLLKDYLAQFGLSPAQRSKMHVEPAPVEKPPSKWEGKLVGLKT